MNLNPFSWWLKREHKKRIAPYVLMSQNFGKNIEAEWEAKRKFREIMFETTQTQIEYCLKHNISLDTII